MSEELGGAAQAVKAAVRASAEVCKVAYAEVCRLPVESTTSGSLSSCRALSQRGHFCEVFCAFLHGSRCDVHMNGTGVSVAACGARCRRQLCNVSCNVVMSFKYASARSHMLGRWRCVHRAHRCVRAGSCLLMCSEPLPCSFHHAKTACHIAARS